MAVCSFSLPIPCNAEAPISHDPSPSPIRATATFPDLDARRVPRGWWGPLVSTHARGRLPRPRPADGGTDHAMAGARSRGNRTPGDAAYRSRDEWRAEDGSHAFDFSLRAF